MVMVIENAKSTLEHSNAHSSKHKKQTEFNYCLKLLAYFGNVIIGFLILIFVTFGKTQVKYECTPHYWLSTVLLS